MKLLGVFHLYRRRKIVLQYYFAPLLSERLSVVDHEPLII